MLCASGLHNIGTDLLLNFIVENFPAPTEHEPVAAKLNGQEVQRAIKDSEPVSAFVFKTVADPFRRPRHVLQSDVGRGEERRQPGERPQLGRRAPGAHRRPGRQDHPAGELNCTPAISARSPSSKDTLTGDTLADKSSLISYPPVQFPEPSIAFAISAKSRQDEDRLGNAVQRILEEDQSLRFYRDPQTKEFLLAGSGQQHVEVIV